MGDYQAIKNVKPNIYKKHEGKRYQVLDFGDGLEMIDSGGTGCIMIARRVLEAVQQPFKGVYDDYGVRVTGQDIEFCRRVKELGFEIWTHWDYPCHHFKTIDLLNEL